MQIKTFHGWRIFWEQEQNLIENNRQDRCAQTKLPFPPEIIKYNPASKYALHAVFHLSSCMMVYVRFPIITADYTSRKIVLPWTMPISPLKT